ncbi:unnamed protein product [Penicillium salamii]|nr:unnamed protein product [Penicillium salamii]CAG8186416.1 unnamed protein product [Penicillium salamii]CAG8384312.1 unnamed protein product [Penicillium salamii]
MSLFWVSQYDVSKRMGNLTVWVVDFDGQVTSILESKAPIIGPAVVNVTKSISKFKNGISYEVRSPAIFGNDPRALRQAVYDEEVYAAVIVSPDATSTLLDAVKKGDRAYSPSQAAQIVTISARDQVTYSSYIEPALTEFEREVITEFGPLWVEWLKKHEMLSFEVLQPDALHTISPGIWFEKVDLRPFSPAVATPAVTVGLIYLIILSFFIFPFLMPVHMQLLKGDHPPLKNYQWVDMASSNHPAPGSESAPNANAYGKGSFVVFWMLNWIGMAALGLPCENMAMILGAPYSSIFLIFWVISNVSTGFYALDLAPSFFRWGYVWPLHRIVEALRTILFGTHSRIGLDFGILFAWVGVSIALFPLATHIMQRKQRADAPHQNHPLKKDKSKN